MKTKFFKLFCFVTLAMTLTGCYDKELDMTVLQKTLYENEVFNQIQVNEAWDVTIVQDDEKTGVDLQYSAFLEDYLKVNLQGERLVMGFTKHVSLPASTVLQATVYVQTIEEISLDDAVSMTLQGIFQGSAKGVLIDVKDASTLKGGTLQGGEVSLLLDDASAVADITIEGESIQLKATDASTLKGTFTAGVLNIIVQEASSLTTYGGSAPTASVFVQQAASLNMLQTPVDEMQLEIKDASEANINVINYLWGTAEDASKVYYQGNPTINFSCDDTSIILPL